MERFGQYDIINKMLALPEEKFAGSRRFAMVETYGCQQNVSDSEKIKGILCACGFETTDDREKADIIIFNTCAVRENAELRVMGNIGALKALKHRKPTLKIGVCGCMTQQSGVAEKLGSKFPFLDIIIGTFALPRLAEILYQSYSENKQVLDTDEKGGTAVTEDIPVLRDGKIKASVTVMYGCNNFCTYCVVPYVRGRERSRGPEEIINEVRTLVKEGYKEILLLGQNVNSYGKDLDCGTNFAGLLREINNIEGDFWVRFMTSHPKDATKELFDTIAQCDKLCGHIHLPVQSGSDHVLSAMNRRYSAKDYLALIEYARSVIDNLAITSDIIVGFPGETEEEFHDTLSLVEKAKYDTLYTFLYSKRSGTAAAKMDCAVPEEIKHSRFNRLLELQNGISRRINEALVGKTVKVLFEGVSENNKSALAGRTEGNKTVNVPADESIIGKFALVKITEAKTWSLSGELIL